MTPTDQELDALVDEAKDLFWTDILAGGRATVAGRMIDAVTALRAENARLLDKVDGLETELESAVEVAFKRGAVEWTRLNYPETYARQVARQALGGADDPA